MNVTITPDPPFANPSLSSVLVSLTDAVHLVTPLTKFEVKESATPGTYNFKLFLVDGRLWKSDIRWDGVTAWETFNINDEFKLPELVPVRPLRMHVITLLANGVTHVEVTW